MSLYSELAAGSGRLCGAWRITRKDGAVFAFTDHDEALSFSGQRFLPSGALRESERVGSSGLSVDGGEVIGVLQHGAIREEDLAAGRFDGAALETWRVDWGAPETHDLVFCGSLGEITLESGRWRAEVRGLTEALSKPMGRSYQRLCTAVLGDNACRFAVESEGFSFDVELSAVEENQHLLCPNPEASPRWFERGRIEVLSGAAKGLSGAIKADGLTAQGLRRLTLWAPLGAPLAGGDRFRLIAGCDKRLATCRGKFGNVVNYAGFPYIPGEAWLLATPKGEAESLFQ